MRYSHIFTLDYIKFEKNILIDIQIYNCIEVFKLKNIKNNL